MSGQGLADAMAAGLRELPRGLWDAWASILDELAGSLPVGMSPAAGARTLIADRLDRGIVTDREARDLLDHLAERIRQGHPL